MSIMTVGIDLAKNVFAVHGVDENGKAVLIKPKVSRKQLLPLIAQLPPCRIGLANALVAGNDAAVEVIEKGKAPGYQRIVFAGENGQCVGADAVFAQRLQ